MKNPDGDTVILTDAAFDPAERLTDLTARSAGTGAVASFTGIARPNAKSGERVESLYLDHHPRLTLKSIEEIAEAARTRFEVMISIVHRCGEIAAGEPIVFVAASAVHRRAAFDAVDYAMDRLKTEALFWKREDGPDGSRWIEPSDADYRARARWEPSCQG